MPAGPIKCAGAPHKIAYLATGLLAAQGVMDKIRVVLVLPTGGTFGVKVFSDELERVVAKYGLEMYESSEVTAVNPDGQQATVGDNTDQSTQEIHYDFLHLVPPQSAPDWLARTDLADPITPRVCANRQEHHAAHQVQQRPRFRRRGLLAQLQDRRRDPQTAPVVAANLQALIAGKDLPASYDGYASCPLTTARNKRLLAELDYTTPCSRTPLVLVPVHRRHP